MYNPVYMSNNFLIRSFRDNSHITSMKIQKMLYFLYRDYLKATNLSLFSERFSTWRYGPVLESVYYTYKKYGSNVITTYGGEPAYSIQENDDPVLKTIMDDIWIKSRPYTGIDLSRLTHRPECAWHKAWINSYPFLLDDDIKNDPIQING